MKARRHAVALLPLALLGAVACASAGGTDTGEDTRSGSAAAPIVGGQLDTMTKGVVALARGAHGQVGVICSGSLLAPNLVLTARHCVSRIDDGSTTKVTCNTSQFTAKYNPRELFVSTDAQPQGDSKLYPIKEIREAPGSLDVCGFDLALLILSGSGIPESEAEPIEPVLDHAPRLKQAFAAVGYGLRDPADQLSAGTRMRFDASSVYCIGTRCPIAYATEEDEWVGKSPVCSGDSGGPALDADGRVFGVTSRGDEKCTFAIYSNVSDWAAFVRSTALVAATSGGYPAPSWTTEPDPGAAGSSASNDGAMSTAGTTSPPAAPVGPTVDPLGTACTTADCAAGYLCYAATGAPPGVCVPACSASASSCPVNYACSESLGACIPVPTKSGTSGGCALGGGSKSARDSSALVLLLGLGVLWHGRRRRHSS